MRSAHCLLLITALAGCGSCGEAEDSTRPPPVTEAEPEPPPPPPDPCVASDADLAAFAETSPIALGGLPQGAGGEPLGEATIVWVDEFVAIGIREIGTVEIATELLSSDESPLPEGPVVVGLRASDPVSRVAPLLRALLTDGREVGLLQHETGGECAVVTRVTFALKTDEDHGWVTFPTSRPVSDLATALSGADTPRRVQLIE